MKFNLQKLKRGVRSTLIHPSFRLLHRFYTGLGTCLLYHQVTNELNGSASYINLAVHLKEFERQIEYLSRHYHCVALPEAIEKLTEGTLAHRSIIVTFDDGYRDNLAQALPVLERYGVPATIFVTTGFIDGASLPWWYEQDAILRQLDAAEVSWNGRSYSWKLETPAQTLSAIGELHSLFSKMNLDDQNDFMQKLRRLCPRALSSGSLFLSWDELSELARHPLITIGAHTKNHPVLSRLSAAEVRDELAGGKEILERRLGRSIDHFAYPFGGDSQVCRRELAAAREAGFRSAFTTRFGHLHPTHRNFLHSLPRITIGAGDTISVFKQKLMGIESMIQHRGRRVVVD